MKKFIKFLPILGASACAISCMPFVTSCKSDDSVSCEWDFAKAPWVSTIPAKKDWKIYTPETVMDLYFDDCANNKKILAEDIMSSISNRNVMTASNITYGKVTVKDVNTKEHRVSYDMHIKFWMEDEETSIYNFEDVNFTIENMPLKIVQIDNDTWYDPWYFDRDRGVIPAQLNRTNAESSYDQLDKLIADKKWSINVAGKRWNGLKDKEEFEYIYNSEFASTHTEDKPEDLYDYLTEIGETAFETFYLREIEIDFSEPE